MDRGCRGKLIRHGQQEEAEKRHTVDAEPPNAMEADPPATDWLQSGRQLRLRRTSGAGASGGGSLLSGSGGSAACTGGPARPLDACPAHLCAVGSRHGRFYALQRHLVARHRFLLNGLAVWAADSAALLVGCFRTQRKGQEQPGAATICMQVLPDQRMRWLTRQGRQVQHSLLPR